MGGATRVGPQARRESLDRMRERYESAGREARSRLLDEVCEVTGYQRRSQLHNNECIDISGGRATY